MIIAKVASPSICTTRIRTKALWHAYVDEDVTRLTGADAEQRIKAVVTAIFEKFPAGVAPAAGASKS